MIRFFILILMGWCAVGSAQEVTFEASTDAKEIVQGNYFRVTFTIKNGQAESFEAPDFGYIDVLAGPNRSSQVSIINGRMSQQMSYTYTLSPSKVGTTTVGPASAVINGKTYTTQPVSVKVLKGNAEQQKANTVSDDDLIVEAKLSHEVGHIGQQLTLKYVLYTTKDIGSYNFQQIPKFDGFYVEGLPNYRDRPQTVVRDGVQYTMQAIRAYALFPQQKGRFVIDPVQVQLGLTQGNRNGSFFFNRQLRPVNVMTNGLTIDIVDIDTDSIAPVSYADAIGSFYLGTALDKRRLAKDDALTLTYQIKGDGDRKIFKAPEQPLADLFEIYEPNLLREEWDYDNDRVVAIKTYEYLMIPKKEGPISFRPELSYYHPDSQRYVTIMGETYNIDVTPPTGRQRQDLAQQKEEWPLPYGLADMRRTSSSLWATPIHYGILGLFGLSFLGMLFFYQQKKKNDAIDPALKKNARAKKIAIAKLQESKNALDKGDQKEFYIQLRKGLLEYLSSKTYQDSAQMSKEDIITLLQNNHLSEHQEDIIDVMNKGDMAIYANISSGDERQMYDKIVNIIEKIETSLKK